MELNFESHISSFCSKANRKLNALIRVAKFMSFNKKRILFKTFFESQFKYCPLIWMFCSRTANNKINKLHERAIRIIYDDYENTFEDLLAQDGSFTVHHMNIQTLILEIYKVKNNISTNNSMKDLLCVREDRYNFRSKSDFLVPSVNSVFNGENSIRYFGPKIWNLVPNELRNVSNFGTFKAEIRKWKPPNCPCRLCKNYIRNIGFVNIAVD